MPWGDGFSGSQCQAVALSQKKKTAGRPPDWPEETDSDAKWEQLACNEVIWEEMINADANAMDTYNEEVALDAEKTSKADTLDDKHSKEVALDAEKASEEDTQDVEKDSALLKRVHGERSEGMT